MKNQHDMERALRDSRDEADEHPLMSVAQIETLLASTPPVPHMTSTPTRTSKNLKNMAGIGAGLVAATTAVLYFTLPQPEPNDVSAQRSRRITTVTAPPSAYTDVATEPAAHPATAAPTAAKPTPLPAPAIGTIQADTATYTALGLIVDAERIVFSDHGIRMVASASGVNASRMQQRNAVGKAPDIAPRLVVIYHDQQHFASYWDKQDDLPERNAKSSVVGAKSKPTLVNNLIAIRIALSNENTMASQVDAILWYEPTPAVVNALPEPFRSHVRRELGTAATEQPTTYTTPETSATAFAAMTVFPNPLRTQTASIRVTFSSDVVSSAIVTDMFGKTVATLWQGMSYGIGQHDIPVNGLDNAASGVYNIVVTSDGSSDRVIERLMIQR